MTLSEPGGCVYVVATPIGNLDDLGGRALEVLRGVDLICCEDTRHTAKLAQRFGIATRRVSLHEHNEAKRIPELLEKLEAGARIALVSDAGTPLVSDPGERLVAAAIAAGARVVPVPGPSAVLAALVASGLPAQPFAFAGFPPRKGRARRDALEGFARFPGSVIWFEAAPRLAATLADLHEACGPRRVAVARELTKLHEEVLRGVLGELRVEAPRGELVIVVGPPEAAAAASAPDPDQVDSRLRAALAAGASVRDASREVADALGLPRRETYARALALRDEG